MHPGIRPTAGEPPVLRGIGSVERHGPRIVGRRTRDFRRLSVLVATPGPLRTVQREPCAVLVPMEFSLHDIAVERAGVVGRRLAQSLSILPGSDPIRPDRSDYIRLCHIVGHTTDIGIVSVDIVVVRPKRCSAVPYGEGGGRADVSRRPKWKRDGTGHATTGVDNIYQALKA